jgi:hypothetical protein
MRTVRLTMAVRSAPPPTLSLLRSLSRIRGKQRRRDEASRDQGFIPELKSDLDRVDPDVMPPSRLVAAVMYIAVMLLAERDGEFVADLAPKRPRLGKTNMVGFGWPGATQDARLRRDMPCRGRALARRA